MQGRPRVRGDDPGEPGGARDLGQPAADVADRDAGQVQQVHGTWYKGTDNYQTKTRKRLTKMLISPPSHSLQLSTTTGQFCSSENSGRVVSIAVASWQTGKLAMQYYGNAWLLHSVNCSNYTEYSKHRPLVPIQNMLWKLISA